MGSFHLLDSQAALLCKSTPRTNQQFLQPTEKTLVRNEAKILLSRCQSRRNHHPSTTQKLTPPGHRPRTQCPSHLPPNIKHIRSLFPHLPHQVLETGSQRAIRHRLWFPRPPNLLRPHHCRHTFALRRETAENPQNSTSYRSETGGNGSNIAIHIQRWPILFVPGVLRGRQHCAHG